MVTVVLLAFLNYRFGLGWGVYYNRTEKLIRNQSKLV